MDQSQQQSQNKVKVSYKDSPDIFQSSFNFRKWLKTHGKADYIDFTDDAILKLRQYFDSLDDDKSGSIGVDELEDPLIALGLAQSRQEVIQLIDSVDDDKSGYIEFKEFLAIMSWGKQKQTEKSGNKNSDDQNEKGAIFDFFKKLSEDQLGDEMDKNIPFTLNVSQYRRRKILDAIMGTNKEKKDKGQKIMQAFKKQLIFMKQQEKIEKGEDPNDKIPNNENGVNTRNGFPKLPKIIKANDKLLIKPKATAVQNNTDK